MQFIDSDFQFPISSAVVHSGRVFEAFVTGIPDRERQPVPSGAGAETREIFCQLDTFLAAANVDRFAVCTARLYLRDVLVDIAAVNVAWKRTGREGTARTGEELADPALPERVRCARINRKEFFGEHPVVRRAYGVQLQAGMRVEAAFTAELGPAA